MVLYLLSYIFPNLNRGLPIHGLTVDAWLARILLTPNDKAPCGQRWPNRPTGFFSTTWADFTKGSSVFTELYIPILMTFPFMGYDCDDARLADPSGCLTPNAYGQRPTPVFLRYLG